MITKTQQHIIDSITNEFERINNIESTPISRLAQRIKGEISEFNYEQDEFKLQTEFYEKANQFIFDDFCKQVEALCSELGLIFRCDNGKKIGLFTDAREIIIVFPQFGNIQKSWLIKPMTINSCGLKGLESANLYLKTLGDTTFYSYNALPKAIDTIAEKIIETHKMYSK